MSTHFSVIRAMQLDPSITMGMDLLSTDAAATGLTSIEQEEASVNVYAALQQESVQEKRGWLRDALSIDFGLVQDLTPRAFKNAAHEGVGSGSCWINAALQSLFGSRAVQYHLRSLFRRLRNKGSNRLSTPDHHLWQVGSRATVAMLRTRCALDDDIPKDAKLAITFMASMSSLRPTEDFVNGDAFLPGLALRTWYERQRMIPIL